jgi:TIR domain
MYPYRVFISYSHSDRETVERLAEMLDASGLDTMWDKHLLPGAGFSEQIQGFITNAHIFLPFITKASAHRP